MSGSWSDTDRSGNKKVKCEVCGQHFHRLEIHISHEHSMKVADYKAQYPGAPILSEYAKKRASDGQLNRKPTTPKAPQMTIGVDKASGASVTTTSKVFTVGRAQLAQREKAELDPFLDQPYVPAFDDGWEMSDTMKEAWELMALAIDSRQNLLWVGPTGNGKTSSVLQLASLLNQPVQRINMDGDVRKADFVGEKVVDVDETSGQSVTRWVDGILPTAMRRGHWLLIDELDAAPAQILFVLQAVLERSTTGAKLVLTGNGGEVVKAHPNFRILATANTKGRGDDSGMYQGTNSLNEAFLDRFGVVLETSYPDVDVETRILTRKTGIRAEMARKMVSVANEVRRAAANEQCYTTFSTRRLLAWAQQAVWFGAQEINGAAKAVSKAASGAVLNRMSKDDKAFVASLIQRYFGN